MPRPLMTDVEQARPLPAPGSWLARLAAGRAIRRGRARLKASTSAEGERALAEAGEWLRTALRHLDGRRVTRQRIEATLLLATVHDRMAERDAGLDQLDASAELTGAALAWDMDPRLRARLLGSHATTFVRRGERTGEMPHLLTAVDTFRAALAQCPSGHPPLLRATLLAGLGTALVRMAEREIGTDRAEAAVIVLREALAACPRRRSRKAWASIRNTLSTAQTRLAERTGDRALLAEAAEGLRQALRHRRRDEAPIGWAATITDLGYVLAALGEKEGDASLEEEALRCYRLALEEVTLATSPRDFAEIQINVAGLLRRQGERSGDRSLFLKGLHALNEAQKGVTREDCPLDWATAELSRTALLIRLGIADGQPEPIDDARAAVEGVLAVVTPELAAGPYREALRLKEGIAELLADRTAAQTASLSDS